MRVLFLMFHGLSEVSGISKKVIGQVEGLRENVQSVDFAYYDIEDNGNRNWLVSDVPVVSLGKGVIGKLRKRIDFRAFKRFVQDQKYDLVYIRSFHNANPFTIDLVKGIKRSGAQVLLEVPTYPYDQEYQDWKVKPELFIDKLFRTSLMKNVDAVVTFSEDEIIFGQKTIQISNGVNFQHLFLREDKQVNDNEIHLIAVAEIHFWHGLDRIVKGLADYYKKNPELKVYLHIVGDYSGARERQEIEGPIHAFNLEPYVIRHGALFGEALDAVFEKCDFAIGSLGRHRSGISRMKSLKNREYAARGIPFAYAESDPDFDSSPYVLRFRPDEENIDVSTIIDFLKENSIKPIDIRQSIQHLSWKNQMGIVLTKLSDMASSKDL